MSDTLAIVQWTGETNYYAVRRGRILAHGRTELDNHKKSKSKDIKERYELALTVSGQNTIGIYITPLVLIQPTDLNRML